MLVDGTERVETDEFAARFICFRTGIELGPSSDPLLGSLQSSLPKFFPAWAFQSDLKKGEKNGREGEKRKTKVFKNVSTCKNISSEAKEEKKKPILSPNSRCRVGPVACWLGFLSLCSAAIMSYFMTVKRALDRYLTLSYQVNEN